MKRKDIVYIAPDGQKYEMDRIVERPWWKVEEEYSEIMNWESSRIAWEFLRRNPCYFIKFHEWKWHRSQAMLRILRKSHKDWKFVEKLCQEIYNKFGIDSDFLPVSPRSSEICPIFIDQTAPRSNQIIITEEAFNKTYQGDPFPNGEKIYLITPGGNWPRRKSGKPSRRLQHRREWITYLRLLDADAEGAPSEFIRSRISCYRYLSKEDAQRRLDVHRRRARQMITSDYRRIAASD